MGPWCNRASVLTRGRLDTDAERRPPQDARGRHWGTASSQGTQGCLPPQEAARGEEGASCGLGGRLVNQLQPSGFHNCERITCLQPPDWLDFVGAAPGDSPQDSVTSPSRCAFPSGTPSPAWCPTPALELTVPEQVFLYS